tara:strand:- start:462 stop:1235 length:774 start_codon:yes stop_codon:yes gene_type:complete
MPIESYGVRHQNKVANNNDFLHESFKRKGFIIYPSKMKAMEMSRIEENFEKIRESYSQKYFQNKESNFSIRALFSFDKCFLNLARSKNLIKFLKLLFDGDFILNQQNGLINSPNYKYNQAKWHRDLPYQHFISSKNIAVNVIYCIDQFTIENGCSEVLPYSQLFEDFPSDKFVLKNYEPVIANAGDFIILNAMTFHKGGINKSSEDRRGINTVYSIPFIRHQLDVTTMDYKFNLTESDKKFLGFQYASSKSIKSILL